MLYIDIENIKTGEKSNYEDDDLVSLSQSLQVDEEEEYDPNKTASFQPNIHLPEANRNSKSIRNSFSSINPPRESFKAMESIKESVLVSKKINI